LPIGRRAQIFDLIADVETNILGKVFLQKRLNGELSYVLVLENLFGLKKHRDVSLKLKITLKIVAIVCIHN